MLSQGIRFRSASEPERPSNAASSFWSSRVERRREHGLALADAKDVRRHKRTVVRFAL
jgi:hypothetical protein